MSEVLTGADSLQFYLTGAHIVGVAQPDHDDSLGGKRAYNRADAFNPHRLGMIRNVRINSVQGQNGEGLGSLDIQDDDTLRWTAPNGSPGDAVTILNGETKVVADTDTQKFAIVSRTSSVPMIGAETVQLLDLLNNVVGGSNISSAESTAGVVKYRAVIFAGTALGSSLSVEFWLDAATASGTAIAIEPDSDGEIQTIADETTAPGGLSFTSPTEGSPLAYINPGDGATPGLWIRRTIGASASASSMEKVIIHWKALQSPGVITSQGQLRGAYQIAEASLPEVVVFISTDAIPDITGTPDKTIASFPGNVDSDAVSADDEYFVVAQLQDAYGLRTRAFDIDSIIVGASFEELPVPPSGPSTVSAVPVAAGKVNIRAAYSRRQESPIPATANALAADTWLLYITTDGVDPDPDVDVPTEVAMNDDGNQEFLDFTTGAQTDQTEVKVIVRTRRSGTPDADSTNTTVFSATAAIFGPLAPHGAVSIGRRAGVYVSPDVPDEIIFIDEPLNIYWEVLAGETRLWADTVLVWTLRFDSGFDSMFALKTIFQRDHVAAAGAGTGAIEVGTWNVGVEQKLHINVGTTRVCDIDVLNEVILFAGWDAIGVPSSVVTSAPIYQTATHTLLQVWDPSCENYITVAAFDATGTLLSRVGWDNPRTQAEVLAL